MTKRTILILALLLVLVSCGPVSESTITKGEYTPIYNDGIFRVIRVVDNEAKVVCYLMDGYESGGISCIPLEQTALDLR